MDIGSGVGVLDKAAIVLNALEGRALWAQRDRAFTTVREREHLLAHDIGRFADAADEECGVLIDREFDVSVPGMLSGSAQRLLHGAERGGLRRNVIGYTLRPLDDVRHQIPVRK